MKSIGVFGICNNLSLNIYDFILGAETKAIVKYSNENKYHKVKVYTSNRGDYFTLYGTRHYLKDFLRVN